MENEEITWKKNFIFTSRSVVRGLRKFTLGLAEQKGDRNGKRRNCMEEEFFLFFFKERSIV